MIHIPRCCDYEIGIREFSRMKCQSRLVIKSRNGFACSLNRTAQGLIREISGIKEFSEQFVGRILDHFHFFEDYSLFALQIFLVKTRMSD